MAAMDLQRTYSLLLLLLLALPALLVQSSKNDKYKYERFLRQHVHGNMTVSSDKYCNMMMRKRKLVKPQCKPFNTFIHEDKKNIIDVCNTERIKCRNGKHICHLGVMKVTDCRLAETIGSKCKYEAYYTIRQVTIACEGSPALPMYFGS